MAYKLLQGKSVKVTSSACTGSNSLSHKTNQDALLAIGQRGVFAVADGLGGYYLGEEASNIAIKTLEKATSNMASIGEFLRQEPEERLNKFFDARMREMDEMFKGADAAIKWRAKKKGKNRMGTTLAMLMVYTNDGQAYAIAANVGDSPILLFRKSSVHKLYTDDSDRESGDIYTLRQYLGAGRKEGENKTHLHLIPLEAGDVIVCATDGLTDNLSPATGPVSSDQYGKLKMLIRDGSDAARLVAEAKAMKIKRDDITAIRVDIVFAGNV